MSRPTEKTNTNGHTNKAHTNKNAITEQSKQTN